MRRIFGLALSLLIASFACAERRAVVDEGFDLLALGDTTGINAAITDGSYDAGLRLHNSILGRVVAPDPRFSRASGQAFQLTTGTNPTGGYGALSADNSPRSVSLVEGEDIVLSFDLYVQAVPTGTSGLNLEVKLDGASKFSRTFTELANATVGDVVHVVWTNPVGAAEAGAGTISPWISFEGNATNFSVGGPNGNGTQLDIAQIDNLRLEVPDNSVVVSGVVHVDQSSTEATEDGSEAFPYKTISQAAAVMTAGDTCIIHAGTYREVVVVPTDNVTFKRFGNDEVVVTGTDLVSGWTVYSNNIHKAPVGGIETEFTQVFYMGAHQQMARWPDNLTGDMLDVSLASGYAACEAFGSTNATRPVVFAETLPGGDDYWVGGYFRGITGYTWMNPLGIVASSSGNTIECTPTLMQWKDNSTILDGPGFGYIFHLNALSREGEWWYDSGYLYFWAPSGGYPGDETVEVQTRKNAFVIQNRKGVELLGLHIIGASAVIENCSGCKLDNCLFEYIQPYLTRSSYGTSFTQLGGVYFSGDSNRVSSCVFRGSWGNLVSLASGSDNVVDNSVFDDNGWIAQFTSSILNGGYNTTIDHCTFGSTGRFHVRTTSPGSKVNIRYSDLYDCMKLGQDAGSIQAVGVNLGGSEFSCNSLHDSSTLRKDVTGTKQFVVAFYLEDCPNYRVDHNVVYNYRTDYPDGAFCYLGPRHESITNLYYYNNTAWNCDWRIRIWNRDGLGYIGDAGFWNNVFDADMGDGFGTPSLEGGITFSNNVDIARADADTIFVDAESSNFELLADSAAVDAGMEIPGITDGFLGSAPDAGAIEAGTFMWRTGASITNSLLQQPFGGIRQKIPDALIWAAHYDVGGIGIAYHDLTMGNDGGIYRADSVDLVASPGGLAVGSTVGGEWLEYSVDVAPGPYQLKLNASAADSNRVIRVQIDGSDLAAVSIPNTGSRDVYATVSTNVVVGGTSSSRLRVCFDTGGTNLESIEFAPIPILDGTFFDVADSNVVMGVTNGAPNSWFAVYSTTSLVDGAWSAKRHGVPVNASGFGAFTNSIIHNHEFFKLMQSGAPLEQ